MINLNDKDSGENVFVLSEFDIGNNTIANLGLNCNCADCNCCDGDCHDQ